MGKRNCAKNSLIAQSLGSFATPPRLSGHDLRRKADGIQQLHQIARGHIALDLGLAAVIVEAQRRDARHRGEGGLDRGTAMAAAHIGDGKGDHLRLLSLRHLAASRRRKVKGENEGLTFP